MVKISFETSGKNQRIRYNFCKKKDARISETKFSNKAHSTLLLRLYVSSGKKRGKRKLNEILLKMSAREHAKNNNLVPAVQNEIIKGCNRSTEERYEQKKKKGALRQKRNSQ